jgi:LemA protein
MNESNSRIPEEIADDVLRVASELYAKTQNSFSVSDLQVAGQEVNIPPELIDQAIEQVKEQRRLEEEKRLQAKQTKRTLSFVGAGLATVAALWGILSYNSLNNSSQQVDAAWAQVENQLQRRADLIPKLVNVTKAQAKQEQTIIKMLTDAQNKYNQARTPNEKLAASDAITVAIQQFSQTPLGSSQVFSNLQFTLEGTENRIATERKRYNDSIRIYNQKVQSFPNSIVAGLTGFQPKDFLKPTNTADPKIDL